MKVTIRKARAEDVTRIIYLINDGGPLGRPREELPSPLPATYSKAFGEIDSDPKAFLMVAEIDGEIVGTFYLLFLNNLMGKGREDAQLESVHVAKTHRGLGIGTVMMEWAIAEARKRNCRRLQLTTDKNRKDAHRFYEKLGFVSSHEGMKFSF